jgi:RNA polymerase sigma-70 factor (ECF subfamily)
VTITEQAFKDLFKAHYQELYRYAFSMTRDKPLAEEKVSDAFFKLWNKKDAFPPKATLIGYLYSSVYHACLDHWKHEKIKMKYEMHVKTHASKNVAPGEASNRAELNDFQEKLQESLASLPEQCRTIFHLSRTEELTYQEIAIRLRLSIKTVETQMGRALRRLRISMKDFLPLLIICYAITS